MREPRRRPRNNQGHDDGTACNPPSSPARPLLDASRQPRADPRQRGGLVRRLQKLSQLLFVHDSYSVCDSPSRPLNFRRARCNRTSTVLVAIPINLLISATVRSSR